MTKDTDVNPSNLISGYWRLNIEDICTYAMIYIVHQIRQVQNSIQMYHCTLNLITDTNHLKIVAETQKYTLQGTTVGELSLKLLMQNVIINI